MHIPFHVRNRNTAISSLRSRKSGMDDVSKIELGFPHDFLEKPMVRSFSSGGLQDRIFANARF
jgi:hypothetical protein